SPPLSPPAEPDRLPLRSRRSLGGPPRAPGAPFLVSTPAAKGGNDLRQLGWLLAWAVVFCDIGTSIYYVPGILYHDVGDLAATFIGLVTIGFLFLAQKIQEVTWRNPEGGGVVSMSAKAFGPMAGAVGGMLIIVDYFLTAAIS